MTSDRRRVLPTREQLRVWRNYIETAEVLRTRLGSRLQADTSLSSGDYQVLLALSESEPKSVRPSELATQIGWERSRLSHHLGRMAKRGLIERNSCANDVHGVEVSITETGEKAFRSASVPHLRAVRELFLDALSPEQLAHVDDLTVTLRRHLGLTP
ncbi:MarR family transcriptional regulator [Saccharopolyspora karakumensis]|uniref:MarR family transcriptional regulator n=1 Tax=Saccharopolyspora karakumensis TaxID=2530386 RepID=A0A4V2YVB3_9PSEU|nr:MarR family transcriptional regulator [Saccharopolyspora karakumensis]TDD80897.1 MarR family transcriptional regulator [Saccharopolyspora karakumensis]